MQISKNITKLIKPLDNADETYDIKAKYDYYLKNSLVYVYVKIKNLLDNKKRKIYYKIEALISALYLNKNKKEIYTDKLKTDILSYPKGTYELYYMLDKLSKEFNNMQYYFKLKKVKVLSININIYYDYNKVKM